MLAAVDQVVLAALVPPPMPRLPLLVPAASMLTRMFSIDWAVRAQLVQASRYRVQVVVLKRPAGKSVREVQPCQAPRRPVNMSVSVAKPMAASKLSAGKAVRPVQFCQVKLKLAPDEVSIRGKAVRLEHPSQVSRKLVPAAVSIRGKAVRLLQMRQV